MRKLLIICFAFSACKHPKVDSMTKMPIDTFRRHMLAKVREYRATDHWDSAGSYLNQLVDTVRKLNNPRLSLDWRLEKILQLNAKKQYDSSTVMMKQVFQLLGSKELNYKDSFNSYMIYLYLLEGQDLKDSALRVANEAYYLAKNDSFRKTSICVELAKWYLQLNDLPNGKKYLEIARAYNGNETEYNNEIATYFAGYYLKTNNIDSAAYYYNLSQNTTGRYIKEPSVIAHSLDNVGSMLVNMGKPQEGLKYQLKGKKIFDSLRIQTSAIYNNLADTYNKLGEFSKAFSYIDSSIHLSASLKEYRDWSTAWATKSEIYFNKMDYKNAYSALDSSYTYYVKEVDSSFKSRARELETQYGVREKDNQIKVLALTNQSNVKIRRQQRTIIIMMIVGILFLVTIGFLFWRRRKTKMLLRENNLKQQLLRVQLSPHFIINSLGILKNLIRVSDGEKATSYLNNFATVLRFKFEDASENSVLFQSEIEGLRAYLDLQSSYWPGLFEYTIKVYDGWEDEDIYILPMLFQPFVENSIIHGFSDINYKGEIKIVIERLSDRLHCIIEDNGKGIRQGNENRKIHSIKINKERVLILAKQTGIPASIQITNKLSDGEQNTGAKIELVVPILFKKMNTV